MHIAFIEDTKLYGGTQMWVMDAINFFLQQGWEVSVISPKNGWITEECQKLTDSINLTTYDYLGITTQSQKDIEIWGKTLANSDIALCTVHPPRNNFHCSTFAARCIKDLNLPVKLVTKTGTIVPSYERQFYIPEQLASSMVIAITKTTHQYLQLKYNIPENRIIQIYQGIDLDYFKQNDSKPSQLNLHLLDSSPIIGCIGSLESRKGQKFLLKAINQVKNTDLPNIHVLIVGDGPDDAQLKDIVKKLKLQSNVTFIPFTRDTKNLFLVCDIIALPSTSKEGLPNVLLEAFSTGIPVIASDIGGVSEVVEDGTTGLLVSPKNVDSLVSAILYLASNPGTRTRMGVKGRQIVGEFHNRKSQMYKFEEFFRSFLTDTGQG